MSRKRFQCPKCLKRYYRKELVSKPIEGAVPMNYLVCPDCDEIVEENKKDD